ncbi:ABC transporter substrate-binding protein [Agromyces subbeticus]|uniref:ABC transporter substrate-binding protein n=1 Tax=Agromyces subbeticus TaxID=293890 RepID=UPI0003B3B43D|nr:ABC transporter substrate-binding protein [Agromyces subbeticus]
MNHPNALTRRRRTRAIGLVGATTSLLLLTGCGAGVAASTDGTTESDDTSLTIENCGRELTITGVPAAVVGMSPSQTELLLRLGLVDRMVGQAQVDTTALPADLAELAADIPVLSDAQPPAREELFVVHPDFVYSPTTYEFTAEQGFASLDQLEESGVDAYVATGGCFDRRMEGTVDDLFVDLENLGRIFQVEDEAAAMISAAQTELDTVAAAIDGLDKPKVAQVYVEGTTLSAIGAGIEYDILRLAGADNVFGPDDDAFSDFFAAQISPEALAVEAPDAIVFSASNPAQEQATRDYLTATFPDLPAVANDRLIAVSAADTFPGTLGNVALVRRIAEALHPDAFAG